MSRVVLVKAPSNIALIKYMGKSDATSNLPENGSLSLTLDSLCTWTEAHASYAGAGCEMVWENGSPEISAEHQVPKLSEKGRTRILKHASRVSQWAPEILNQFGLKTKIPSKIHFKSANTFPAATGIASSASSFASVTLAVMAVCAESSQAFEAKFSSDREFKRALARLSRQGSGSSCRSFEGPFVRWEGENAQVCESKLPKLTDLVLLVGTEPKEVSSSEAHLAVKSSPLWTGRTDRVSRRLDQLTRAIAQGDLDTVSTLTWEESWEMHSLFHTAQPPFTYWLSGSVEVLRWLSQLKKEGAPSPWIATMDAGPNVHLLVPTTEVTRWVDLIQNKFPKLEILRDEQGLGAQVVSVSG